MGTQSLQIPVHHIVIGLGDGVKITVFAFTQAKGDMDIDAQRGLLGLGK
jgi:hypothetical protein